MNHDAILEGFLGRQYEEGTALAAASDMLHLTPVAGSPPHRYCAEFRCKGLVRGADGVVQEHDRFLVGIWFPTDYLRHADPFQVLTWLGPRQVFHPNISDRAPLICVGRLVPGTPLVDLLYQCFEIVTYKKYSAHDALNESACSWARANPLRFPVDQRPLKRRRLSMAINTTPSSSRIASLPAFDAPLERLAPLHNSATGGAAPAPEPGTTTPIVEVVS